MERGPPSHTSVPEWGVLSDQGDFEALLRAVVGYTRNGASIRCTETTSCSVFNAGALARLHALARSKEVSSAVMCLSCAISHPSHTPLIGARLHFRTRALPYPPHAVPLPRLRTWRLVCRGGAPGVAAVAPAAGAARVRPHCRGRHPQVHPPVYHTPHTTSVPRLPPPAA